MGKSVLITGGAGFIGSHLADLLLDSGHSVRILDNLDSQVHGKEKNRPEYLNPAVELFIGDVRDRDIVEKALKNVDWLIHFAAAVGVGQSMYEIERYTSINSLGAAVLLQAVSEMGNIEKMLVASSMSIYGEGLYLCKKCGQQTPRLRTHSQLEKRKWDFSCPYCGTVCTPLPTPETKPLFPSSVYAINKRDHEELFLTVGNAYSIPTVAMRFFNVYGRRQALSNPYTGVGAIFASRLLNNKPPVIFEDGHQSRDFIHVSDVVRACKLALEKDVSGEVFNIGTGKPASILKMAKTLAGKLNRSQEFLIRNEFRAGDIRHCYADISKARKLLGFNAIVEFDRGISELVSWVIEQTAEDQIDAASTELSNRKLVW